MGQGSSSTLFVQVLKNMLKARGSRVSTEQLSHFVAFVEDMCPWFPEEGTVNVEVWQKVGKQLQTYYSVHGPSKVPVDIFSLWTLIKNCLDQKSEKQKWKDITRSAEEKKGVTDEKKSGKETSPIYAEVADEEERPPPSAPPAWPKVGAIGGGTEDEILTPQEQEELEEAAARYHEDRGDWLMVLTDQEQELDLRKEDSVKQLEKKMEVTAIVDSIAVLPPDTSKVSTACSA